MYYVRKQIEISAAHRLDLNYGSKCTEWHGHNWLITICCRARELNEEGMVADFTHIKEQIAGTLDHACLNDVLPFNPTAENIARWICDSIPTCYRVEVQESAGNVAVYEQD